jgi:hypothetical protein
VLSDLYKAGMTEHDDEREHDSQLRNLGSAKAKHGPRGRGKARPYRTL